MDTKQNTEITPRLYRFADLLGEFDLFADRIERARREGLVMGPVPPFEKIKNELCGYFAPGIHVLTGNTGAGKTALALQIAATCKTPAIYVTCEVSPLEILRRLIARVCSVDLRRLKNPQAGMPATDMKEKAREAARETNNLAVFDSTMAWVTCEEIEAAAKAMKETLESEHILVVIDSLHSWARGIDADEYSRLDRAIDDLMKLAARLSCPVLYIAEQNRSANKSSKADVNAGAGHRSIEYGAETVMSLLLDTDKEPNVFGEKCVELTINKNRHGGGGVKTNLLFNGSMQSFTEE